MKVQIPMRFWVWLHNPSPTIEETSLLLQIRHDEGQKCFLIFLISLKMFVSFIFNIPFFYYFLSLKISSLMKTLKWKYQILALQWSWEKGKLWEVLFMFFFQLRQLCFVFIVMGP